MTELVIYARTDVFPAMKNEKRHRMGQAKPFSSKHYKKFYASVREQFAQQISKSEIGSALPIKKCINVQMDVHYPDKKRRDIHGLYEGIADMLTHMHVWVDDCWTVTGPTYLIPHAAEKGGFVGIVVTLRF